MRQPSLPGLFKAIGKFPASVPGRKSVSFDTPGIAQVPRERARAGDATVKAVYDLV